MTTCSTQKKRSPFCGARGAPSPFCGSRWTHCAPSNSPVGATTCFLQCLRVCLPYQLTKCFRLASSASKFLQNSKFLSLSIPIQISKFWFFPSGSVQNFTTQLVGDTTAASLATSEMASHWDLQGTDHLAFGSPEFGRSDMMDTWRNH